MANGWENPVPTPYSENKQRDEPPRTLDLNLRDPVSAENTSLALRRASIGVVGEGYVEITDTSIADAVPSFPHTLSELREVDRAFEEILRKISHLREFFKKSFTRLKIFLHPFNSVIFVEYVCEWSWLIFVWPKTFML